MSPPALNALADSAGLLVDWIDVASKPRTVAPPTLRAALQAMGLACATEAQCRDSQRALASSQQVPALFTAVIDASIAVNGSPGVRYQLIDEADRVQEGRFHANGHAAAVATPGYYQLHVGDTAPLQLAVAPSRCWSVADACNTIHPRAWGVGLQVYSAPSALDASIGDADGALDWARRIAAAGGDALALSPVHAARPVGRYYSPYSPSDRRYFDPLHAAPVQVLGEAAARAALHACGLAPRFAELHAAKLVDWQGGAQAKGVWLRQLHVAFDDATRRRDFDAFVREGGDALAAYAAFAARDAGDGDVAFQLFAQWLAARSWSGVQQAARDAGMRIGLISDLAVGFDPHGAEAAAWPDAVLPGLVLGAPPDAFNADGQAWGIGTYSPTALKATGFAPFISLLRAVMHGRGGVRIDHILGLLRLWVLPEGGSAGDGVYLRYPFEDMLRLLALESWRNRCIVIGEDLGVVPDGLRDTLAQRGVLGIDVLMFTRDKAGAFLPPAQWRDSAVATTTTHDLPTLAGWRIGRDLDWRAKLGTGGQVDRAAEGAQREDEVARLAEAVQAEQLDDGDAFASWLAFAARSPSPLALLPAEDALALEEQPNLPGVVDGHPNWCRRLPAPAPPQLDDTLHAFAAARVREANA
ncbi:4-alpha-glucanotransferase [Pseudoxanthomonas sp. GM95]|uniref:4-alpha-glucanotransferase n=1 Tax=Pseudoxanthomonas sp. GM95 TaxID=1881043 RepID=UPI0008C6F667|nr:4-alpha-glucanotransferase [Pseudoxanthomonas sp. GM95]SEM56891.1 4-alpha-glucanotransferase [Pseudoxanthomonas sp. GM95]